MHTNPRASGNFGHAAGSLKTPALPHFTELPLSRCDHACERPDILILTLSQPSVEIIRSTPKGVIWILSSVHVLVGTIVAWIHPFPAQPAKELTTDHDHHDEARTSKTRPGSPMQHRSNTCTALRVRRSPASATRSQQPSCDGCGGASGGAAPAEHKAVAARASTATPGCYNPMQQQAGVSRRVRASPLPTSRNTSRSRDWGGATKRALRLRGSACGIMARDPRVRACGEGHALARCRSFQGGLVQVGLESAGPPVAGSQDGGEVPSALAESLGVATPQAPSRDTGGIGETRRLRRPAQIARDRRRGENAPGGGRPC